MGGRTISDADAEPEHGGQSNLRRRRARQRSQRSMESSGVAAEQRETHLYSSSVRPFYIHVRTEYFPLRLVRSR